VIRERFETTYLELYGHLQRDVPIQIMTWRAVARGPLARARLREHRARPGTATRALRATRPAYWAQTGRYDATPVYDRYGLSPGARLDGPAIVEERESTVLVPPDSTARVDRYLNLIIECGVASSPTGGKDLSAEAWR
jgi:N-methylhydantoinase A